MLVNGFKIVLTGRDGESSVQAGAVDTADVSSSGSAPSSGTRSEGLPTPASLAEVMLSTRETLIEQAAESLLVRIHFVFFMR